MNLLDGLPLALQVGIPVGVFLLLCLLVPMGVVYAQVQKMRQGVYLRRLDEQAAAAVYRRVREEADWAQAQGFVVFEGVYTFELGVAAILAVWRHAEHPSYLVLFLAGKKRQLILVTEFSQHLDLTTGATTDLQLCPQPPGHYVQTFRGLSPTGLLDRHLAAARYITGTGGVRIEPVRGGFEDAFTRGERAQAAYVQTLPAWPLRAPYWFYVRKRLRHNKSIERLHKAGKLLLPNSPGYAPFTFAE